LPTSRARTATTNIPLTQLQGDVSVNTAATPPTLDHAAPSLAAKLVEPGDMLFDARQYRRLCELALTGLAITPEGAGRDLWIAVSDQLGLLEYIAPAAVFPVEMEMYSDLTAAVWTQVQAFHCATTLPAWQASAATLPALLQAAVAAGVVIDEDAAPVESFIAAALERAQATVEVERAHVRAGTLLGMAALSARGFPPLAYALNAGRLAIERLAV